MTAPDPSVHVRRLIMGFMGSQTVRAATELAVFDALGGGLRSVRDLAAELELPELTLTRLLRALAALGLCVEEEPGRFRATAAGELLRADHPRSIRDFAAMFTDPVMTAAWGELSSSVRTGQTSFDAVHGKPFFAKLSEDPRKSALFNASMREATRTVAERLPALYDFPRHHTALDIGGGDGTLLIPILREHPTLRGVILDTPEGAAQAPTRLSDAGVSHRATVTEGDFFTAIPDGADLHLIKSVLHDWDDDLCTTILRHSHAALPTTGTLLIIEPLLPELVTPDLAGLYLSDLNMLVNVGGRERTREEFDQLLTTAGFTLTSATPIPATAFWLLEAQPTPR